jgi:hypothetical protein
MMIRISSHVKVDTNSCLLHSRSPSLTPNDDEGADVFESSKSDETGSETWTDEGAWSGSLSDEAWSGSLSKEAGSGSLSDEAG